MSDDLKSRLRSVGGVRHDGATRWFINPDGPEAADRIEKLEAALRFYSCGCDLICSNFEKVVDCGYTAVKALEGKDE